MTKPDIQHTITSLVNFIINDSTTNDLGLSMTHYFYPETKTWSPLIAEVDDIGDYHTFVAWAGKIFNKKKWIEFPQVQLDIWNEYKHKSGWFPAQIDCVTGHSVNSTLITSLYDYQDLILGLFELWHLTGNKTYQQELDLFIHNISPAINNHNGFIPNKIITPLNIMLPWTSSSPIVAGLIAEHLHLYSQNSTNNTAAQLAEKIEQAWLNTKTFKTHSLLSSAHHPFLTISNTTKLFKEQTNFCFSLLQQPTQNNHLLKQILDKILTFQHNSGAFYSKYNLTKSTIIKDYFDKGQNFAVIDLLTEASVKISKKYLKPAIKCADCWLSFKDPTTNIIPDYILSTSLPKHSIAKLDQTADFFSSLLRLYSVTGDQKYLKEARSGATILSKYFGQDTWWHRIINATTGKPTFDSQAPKNDRPVKRNLTKYVGGALRFYLSLHQVLQGKHMYKDQTLYLMSRDR